MTSTSLENVMAGRCAARMNTERMATYGSQRAGPPAVAHPQKALAR